MNIIKTFCNAVFGTNDTSILKDVRLWVLLIGINTGANLGFNFLFPIKPTLIALFFILLVFFISRKHFMIEWSMPYLFSFLFIFLLQALYLQYFSLSTTLHYILMIAVAIMFVSICGKDFPIFFSGIILIYAVISLICFSYISVGGTIPYYQIENTNIDGGVILRVYNLYYTQLGNPATGLVYGARNCGPFWEPGAFQGFLNLSLWFELTLNRNRDIFWKSRVIVFIITIITTMSTGGFITLFSILLFYFSQDRNKSLFWKNLTTCVTLIVSIYLFIELDFLGEKIASDQGRLAFSFIDFPNIMYAIAGYGYSPESFQQSSISSASSAYNLLRYVGVLGFFCYMIPLFFNRTNHKIPFFVVIVLILMNEPFLSNSLIWWGIPFVNYDEFNKGKHGLLFSNYSAIQNFLSTKLV